MYYIFLDDIRVPHDVTMYKNDPEYKNIDWVIVRSHYEFVDCVKEKGMPFFISFDHDLADEHYFNLSKHVEYDDYKEKTGYDSLKWLCDYVLDNDKKMPKIKFHTANYVGLKNMQYYYLNFLKNNPDVN